MESTQTTQESWTDDMSNTQLVREVENMEAVYFIEQVWQEYQESKDSVNDDYHPPESAEDYNLLQNAEGYNSLDCEEMCDNIVCVCPEACVFDTPKSPVPASPSMMAVPRHIPIKTPPTETPPTTPVAEPFMDPFMGINTTEKYWEMIFSDVDTGTTHSQQVNDDIMKLCFEIKHYCQHTFGWFYTEEDLKNACMTFAAMDLYPTIASQLL